MQSAEAPTEAAAVTPNLFAQTLCVCLPSWHVPEIIFGLERRIISTAAPTNSPCIRHRRRSSVLPRKPVGRRLKTKSHNKKKLATPYGVPSFFGKLHRFRYPGILAKTQQNQGFSKDFLLFYLPHYCDRSIFWSVYCEPI